MWIVRGSANFSLIAKERSDCGNLQNTLSVNTISL